MSRLKRNENEFVLQMGTMTKNMNVTILTQAGISTASWDTIESQFTGFTAAIGVANDLRSQAKAATNGKDLAGKTLRQSTQNAVDRLYATPAITDETLMQLGLPPRQGTPIQVPPVTVTGFEVAAFPSGIAKLKWKRNGNAASTLYEVQSYFAGTWTPIATVNKLSWTDPAATPGVAKSYRIVSTNSRGRSEPCQAVTIYQESDSIDLNLAA